MKLGEDTSRHGFVGMLTCLDVKCMCVSVCLPVCLQAYVYVYVMYTLAAIGVYPVDPPRLIMAR